MIDCSDTGPVPAALVGDKAAELMDLYRASLQSSFAVPEFCLLPATVLEEYYDRRDWAPALKYAALPQPDDLPPGILDDLRPWNGFAADAVAACVRRVAGPLIVRSSLVLPPGVAATGCGCNSTRMFDDGEVAGIHDSAIVPAMLAAFYKAYTSWNLDLDLRWVRRGGGLIFMRAYPFRCLGAAWIGPGGLTVEVDGKYPLARERYVCDPTGTPVHPVRHEILRARDLAALAEAGREVWRARRRGDLVEFEFGIGLDDGRLFLVQTREFDAAPAGPADGFGAFHSVGRRAGMALDLRGRDRDRATVRDCGGDGYTPKVLVLPRTSPSTFDCFGFAWARAQRPAAYPGTVALLVEDTGEIAYGAGFRNHLTRSVMERCPDLFVGQVRVGQLGPAAGWTSLESDGVRLAISSD